MLGALLLLAAAQPASCEVSGRIWGPVHDQGLELEDGTQFAKVGPSRNGVSPVLLDVSARFAEDGVATAGLGSRGFSITARCRLEVFSQETLSLDDGFVAGRRTALRVVSVRGSQVLVVPAPRSDLTRRRDWTPQPIACDSLRFMPGSEADTASQGPVRPEKWLAERTTLHPSRGAPAAFVLEEGSLAQVLRTQLGQAEVTVTLGDGARLTSWVAAEKLQSSRPTVTAWVAGFATGHRAAGARPPLVCRHRLSVYAVQGERSARVGFLEPGWAFDVDGDGELSEIHPDVSPELTLLPGWHWAVPTVELRGCTRTP